MLVQIVLGVMNLGVMAAVAVAIALEKMLPCSELAVRLIAVVMMGLGAWMLCRAGFAP